jgi:hypothetical protein
VLGNLKLPRKRSKLEGDVSSYLEGMGMGTIDKVDTSNAIYVLYGIQGFVNRK